LAGYSSRPLRDKLGIRPESRAALLQAPPGYLDELRPLPPGVSPRTELGRGRFDFIQFFTTSHAELRRRFPALQRALEKDGALWVSWPKRAAKVETDVTEDVVRAVALAHGLVDVKVCAVDEVWSGLKLVVRLKDR
jgi:hypothetical protein